MKRKGLKSSIHKTNILYLVMSLCILTILFLFPLNLLTAFSEVTEQHLLDAILERETFSTQELEEMDLNKDGEEDTNYNGRVDPEETDPNQSGSRGLSWLILLLLGEYVTLEEDNSVSALLTSEGGTLTTTGTAAKFTLTFPPRALSAPTEITLTPISSITGLPISQSVLAAARMNPEGLQLKIPITLEIEPQLPMDLVDPTTIGFMCQEGGEKFHLRAAEVDGNKVTMQFNHFSDAGVSLIDDEATWLKIMEQIIEQHLNILQQLRIVGASPGLICEVAESIVDYIKLLDRLPDSIDNFFTEPLVGCVLDSPSSICESKQDLEDSARESFLIAARKYLDKASQQCLEGEQSGETAFCEVLDCLDILNEYVSWAGGFDLLAEIRELKTCGIYNIEIVQPTTTTVGECFEVGEILQLEAIAKDKKGNVLEGRELEWITDDSNVAKVDDGVVTAKGAGLANLKVQDKVCVSTLPFSYGLPSGKFFVEVSPAVASISISPQEQTIWVGDYLLLTATAKDENDNILNCPENFSWSPEYLLVVDVNPLIGKTTIVKGLAEGKVKVIATAEEHTGEAIITVIKNFIVEVHPATKTIFIGETLPLTVTLKDINGNDLGSCPSSITWTIPPGGVIAFDPASQIVTGIAEGIATIEATCEGESGNANITVLSDCDELVYASYAGSTLELVYRPTGSIIATYTGVEDLEGLDSACDAIRNIYVFYSLEYYSGFESWFETWHMFNDASGWSTPEFIQGIDGSSLSLTFDDSNCWELVYGFWTDITLSINYFNCRTPSEITLATHPLCQDPDCTTGVIDLESLNSERREDGKLHIYYTLEYESGFKHYYISY